MGKKSKKTRWRTLTLNGHQSDSEESSTQSSLQTSKGYQHKYSKFPYSSQSTPIKKFQHESSKSTRSNSTTSEHKTTFNEDEYTRITTPRQDVLFKKGYLNKPKNYQTQTSTGTSSTANSTSTCTPDHQSADGTEGTDLEYESQFVFPNGFIDHNGIYYINSFEPFPLVVYNAPICYPEYPSSRSKRYSTDSLTESVSPHNEEINPELSQNGVGERIINNTPVFTHSYIQPSGYYYSNGVSNLSNGQYIIEETRRIKKKRRRKISKSKSSNNEDLTSEESDDYDSSDEVFNQLECKRHLKLSHTPSVNSINHQVIQESVQLEEVTQSNQSNTNESNSKQNDHDENLRLTDQEDHDIVTEDFKESEVNEHSLNNESIAAVENEQNSVDSSEEEQEEDNTKSKANDAQNLLLQSLLKSSEKNSESDHSDVNKPNSISDPPKDCINDDLQESSLKPDAEEFIPRTLRQHEPLPFDPNVQFLNIPPNFIPVPFLNHIGEMHQSTPFLPPGIPLNLIPSQDPKIIPNFVNLVPNVNFVPKTNLDGYTAETNDTKPSQEEEKQKEIEQSEITTSQHEPEITQIKKQPKTEIDIAKIVSKLEEAAKQQRFHETKRQNYNNRHANKCNTSKVYQTQRGRYLSHNYHQRNRSGNSEQTYERKFKRSEPRSRPKLNEEEGKIDRGKMEEPTPQVKEDQLKLDVTSKESIAMFQEKEEHEKQEEKQDPVNNVNIRLNENCSIINKDFKLENNYSETLKKKFDVQQNVKKSSKANKCPRYEKHNSEKIERKLEEKPVIVKTLTSKPQKSQNQWISVSNRKKRKNKNNEEQGSLDEQEDTSNDDHLFESFDVNLLVDVVPPLKSDENNQKEVKETPNNEEHNIVIENQRDESSIILEVKEETVSKSEKSESQIKEKLLSKPKKKNDDKKKKSKKKSQTKRVIITDVNLEPEKPVSENQSEVSLKEIDVPLQSNLEESNTLLKDTDGAQDLKPIVNEVLEDKIDLPLIIENTADKSTEEATPIKEIISETPEKKNKKKKKKASQKQLVLEMTKMQSASSSNTTLNNLDDSYDFLLENSIVDEFEQKTNIEISQELDKMIQKGIYSNLEEKIRALKISDLDYGFFKTMNSSFNIPEKPNNLINASNFGKILKNTTHLTMPKEVDQENLINIDFSKIRLPDLEPQPSTSKAGIFLENLEVTEIINNIDQNHTNTSQEVPKSNIYEEPKIKTKKEQDTQEEEEEEEQQSIEKGEKQNATIEQDTKNLTTTSTIFSSQPKQDTLYPITQAVKEWMNKTRENTPDVEILKSPNTIYKEFYEIETETKSESTRNSKDELGHLPPVKPTSREPSPLSNQSKVNNESACTKAKGVFNNDDEITVWSVSPQNSVEEDLIDCWENEEQIKSSNLKREIIIQNNGIREIKGSVQNRHTHFNGHIEEGEEAIEIYESKYGKNEDFLKLKSEIEEQRRNMNFPRHGDLPYRAICCSIM